MAEEKVPGAAVPSMAMQRRESLTNQILSCARTTGRSQSLPFLGIRKHPMLYSALFVRMQGKVYSDVRNTSSLELMKYYCFNCRCSTVAMLIKLSSYTTWSTSETIASVQLPLNAVFFWHAVVSHVILRHQCSCSVALSDQVETCFKFCCFTCLNCPEQPVSRCSHPFSVQTGVLRIPLQCLFCALKS